MTTDDCGLAKPSVIRGGAICCEPFVHKGIRPVFVLLQYW